MANLTPTNGLTADSPLPNVYQIERGDPVQGNGVVAGSIGVSNLQAKALVDSVKILDLRIQRSVSVLNDIVLVTADTTIDDTYYGKAVAITATQPITINLPEGSHNHKDMITFIALGDYPVTIKTLQSQDQFKGAPRWLTASDIMYLMPSEQITVVSDYRNVFGGLTSWYVLDKSASIDMTGEIVVKSVIPANANSLKGYLQLDGRLVNRADYPRLWRWLQEMNSTDVIVSETAWTGGDKGKFSTGTNGNNFRTPDLSGRFIRVLNPTNAGIDNSRAQNTLQDDAYEAHAHSYLAANLLASFQATSSTPSVTSGFVFGAPAIQNSTTGSTGSNETRPSNIAMYHLIRV